MNRRTLKIVEICCYVAAAAAAGIFRVQFSGSHFDWAARRNLSDTLVFPYLIFLFLSGVLYRFSRSFQFALLSATVSVLVLVYTLVSYIRVLYVLKCDPRVCWVFVGTPIVLSLGVFSLLSVGTLLIYGFRLCK